MYTKNVCVRGRDGADNNTHRRRHPEHVERNEGKTTRQLRRKHDTAGLADAIILAHARDENAHVLTSDQHLVTEDSVIDITQQQTDER
jgi:predicted nucleic acid-binding protein